MQVVLLYIPCPSIEIAKEIGVKLVEKRSVACANVIENMQSLYLWEGLICEDKEVLLLLKTFEEKYEEVERSIKELHPYEVPCIFSFLPYKVNDAYVEWMKTMIL